MPTAKAINQGLPLDTYPQNVLADSIIIIETPVSFQCGRVSMKAIIIPRAAPMDNAKIRRRFILMILW